MGQGGIMPIKWVQCQQCSRTMNIKYFPEPDQKRCSKDGFGVCKYCCGFSGKLVVRTAMLPFYDYMDEVNEI